MHHSDPARAPHAAVGMVPLGIPRQLAVAAGYRSFSLTHSTFRLKGAYLYAGAVLILVPPSITTTLFLPFLSIKIDVDVLCSEYC